MAHAVRALRDPAHSGKGSSRNDAGTAVAALLAQSVAALVRFGATGHTVEKSGAEKIAEITSDAAAKRPLAPRRADSTVLQAVFLQTKGTLRTHAFVLPKVPETSVYQPENRYYCFMQREKSRYSGQGRPFCTRSFGTSRQTSPTSAVQWRAHRALSFIQRSHGGPLCREISTPSLGGKTRKTT
jgi:hypothetical protein